MPEKPKPKLIGICLSQANTYINAEYITEMERVARREGYRVVVFNTTVDFYWYRQGNTIARSIFHAINYDHFAAIVVVHESFHDSQLMDQIVKNATAAGVPVFCLGAVWEGCISILFDYYEPYKALMRYVIRDRGAKDTFYISGMADEANSAFRVQCYREVLQECGLPWKKENVAYGLFCEDPAREIVRNLLRERGKAPEAIFCANDYMAISVCDELQKFGLRIPEDVMVTGFDGIPIISLVSPKLATCGQNTPAMAERVMGLILALRRGEKVAPVHHHLFQPIFSESCGSAPADRQAPDALSLFRQMEWDRSHENTLFHSVHRMLMQENMRDVLLTLAQAIPADSAIYLNESFLNGTQRAEYDLDYLEPRLVKVPHQQILSEKLDTKTVSLGDLALEDGDLPGISIITAIHSNEIVCGCFVAHMERVDGQNQLIKRFSDVMNLAFAVLLGNIRQRKLLTHLENSLYQDPLTELPNLKGLNRWFDGYTAEEGNHRRSVALSVYQIHRYDYLYETYGISEAEEIVQWVAKNLAEVNGAALQVARINEKQFVVVNDAETDEGISNQINPSVSAFFDRKETFNVNGGKSFYLEVNCGCTTMAPGWQNATLGNLIQLATGEMYLNRMRSGSHEAEKNAADLDEGMYQSFRLLMEKNLFRFFFQPIVDARTGQIYAYEALMRTDAAIGLNPLQILEIAREYNHLYDVERATLFGIMERFTLDYSEFHNNKVFINTIPGHFLTPQDCEELMRRFEGYLDCFVFELTEQDVTTDEELERLKQVHKTGGQTQIAVDDYGTGHSNIVNLLRYTPQIIKIDRALISDIQNDSNKQLFVRNTIEFAHQNGIKALAEGVETSEELRCVIACGADLIQGYYTARPAEQLIAEIPAEIRDEILEENLRRANEDVAAQVYRARDGETLHLIDLALQNYSRVLLPSGEITVIGETAHTVDMVLCVEDGAKTRLRMDHVNLRGPSAAPIQLGQGSEMTLKIIGQNILNKEGILVPAGARLRIIGSGSLTVNNNRNFAVGIGANFNDPYGTIEVDMDGTLAFHAAGDKVVCLGGGRNAGEGILLRRGTVSMETSGLNVLGIGSTSGRAVIHAERGIRMNLHMQGNDAVALGSMCGNAEILLGGEISVLVDSERAAGIGTLSGNVKLRVEEGNIRSVVHCDLGACIGAFTGDAELTIMAGKVLVHGEGNCVCGLGSLKGNGELRVQGGQLTGDLLAGERHMLGNAQGKCVITGGNIILQDVTVAPQGPGGEKLIYREPEGETFVQTFTGTGEPWTYVAERNAEGKLGVWIPEA